MTQTRDEGPAGVRRHDGGLIVTLERTAGLPSYMAETLLVRAAKPVLEYLKSLEGTEADTPYLAKLRTTLDVALMQATREDREQKVWMSERHAKLVLFSLSVVLDLPLTKAAQGQIKL